MGLWRVSMGLLYTRSSQAWALCHLCSSHDSRQVSWLKNVFVITCSFCCIRVGVRAQEIELLISSVDFVNSLSPSNLSFSYGLMGKCTYRARMSMREHVTREAGASQIYRAQIGNMRQQVGLQIHSCNLALKKTKQEDHLGLCMQETWGKARSGPAFSYLSSVECFKGLKKSSHSGVF